MLNEDAIREALRTVYDPEIGLDIVTLGLVYGISVSEDFKVDVVMTMTTPGCPMLDVIVGGVESTLKALPEVSEVAVELVWEPAWTPERIEEHGRKSLGY